MPTPQTTIQDLDQWTLLFGSVLIDGFGPDEAASIEFPPAFTKVIGADGKVTRSKTLDKTATVTFKLMTSSSANAALSALLTADLAAPNGVGVLPLALIDRQGTTAFAASSAWISKFPDYSLAREATVVEWMFECSRMLPFLGGA